MPKEFTPPPPFVPRAERNSSPSPWRTIKCRSCARETRYDPAADVWNHDDDGSTACVDPRSFL